MSNQVFPTLPGLTWNVVRAPQWATRIQKAVSGKEFRSAWMSAPIYTFRLSYEVLREAASYQEVQQLVAFFNNVRGSFDSFLYSDPNDNSITAQNFGTGNGVQTAFQLMRSYGGNLEAVGQLNGTPSIYLNGVLQATGFTFGSTGLVTFTTAPVAGTPAAGLNVIDDDRIDRIVVDRNAPERDLVLATGDEAQIGRVRLADDFARTGA